MTAAVEVAEARRPTAPLAAIVRLGARELRNGLKGFYVFVACLALGVTVIAAVGTLADALRAGLASQGAAILGGDVTFSRPHLRATPAERQVFDALGRVSETATMRTMARRPDGADQALIELKAVDSAYPLVGEVSVGRSDGFANALANGGIVADAMLLERLRLKVGDKLNLGKADLTVRGILKSEPDGISDRLTYGPRVLVSLATLEKTGLITPSALIRWRYAIALPGDEPKDRQALATLRANVEKALPSAGFTGADRYDPSPRLTRSLDRLRQFLVLIGLAALLVGGVGIANAVATFVDKRVKVIGTLRSVGATGAQIIGIFLVQILAMASVGIAIGLVCGIAVPAIIGKVYGDLLPVPAGFEVSPESLGLAALYGLLVAVLFALWPLGRAESVRASVLFRDSVQSVRGRPRKLIMFVTVLLVVALFAITVASSDPPDIAFYATGGLVAMLVVFSVLGSVVTRLARWLPRPGSPELALALRHIGAPDGLTRSVVLSLGTGLSLLVAVALANASMIADLKIKLPEQSPDYFLLDVNPKAFSALKAHVTDRIPKATFVDAPMLRGRLVALKGKPVETLKVPGDVQWVLNGDRGLSYSDTVPEGSKVIAGTWWGPGYQGPPLVSFDEEIARKLGLGIGDTVTVNVLGRNVDATVANLREVQWESLALNFIMVFSPNTLEAAPHNLLATIELPPQTAHSTEADMVRELGRDYPSVTAIRVRDAINQFAKLFEKVMIAVQAAGSVTLAAGALVLAGALATGQRRRIVEAVILKTIGARRRQILKAHAFEYALLAVICAAVAVALGAVMAWVAVTRLMHIDFTWSMAAVLETLGLAAALMAVFGGVGTWAVLRAPAVPYLRSE